MTEIVECSLKDMRNFFYKGERVRAHSVKSGWSCLCKVIYVGPFVCTVQNGNFREAYNYADYLCGRIKSVK